MKENHEGMGEWQFQKNDRSWGDWRTILKVWDLPLYERNIGRDLREPHDEWIGEWRDCGGTISQRQQKRTWRDGKTPIRSLMRLRYETTRKIVTQWGEIWGSWSVRILCFVVHRWLCIVYIHPSKFIIE